MLSAVEPSGETEFMIHTDPREHGLPFGDPLDNGSKFHREALVVGSERTRNISPLNLLLVWKGARQAFDATVCSWLTTDDPSAKRGGPFS